MDKSWDELSEEDEKYRAATEKLKDLLAKYDQLDLDKESRAIIDNLITDYNDLGDQSRMFAYMTGGLDLYEYLWEKNWLWYKAAWRGR